MRSGSRFSATGWDFFRFFAFENRFTTIFEQILNLFESFTFGSNKIIALKEKKQKYSKAIPLFDLLVIQVEEDLDWDAPGSQLKNFVSNSLI